MITIPTLTELKNKIISDLETAYGGTIPTYGKSFLRSWAGVQAGMSYLQYLIAAKVQKNIFVDTCDEEMLTRFGRVKIGRNPYPATAGVYEVEVTGEIGAVIPASTTFKSDDDSTSPGYLFVLDSEFTLTSETDAIEIRALTAGTESELSVSDTLTATAPIALVDSSVSVVEVVEIPISAETTDEYRRKVLDAFRLEPQGGAGADYRLWAADVQEVHQSYPFADITSHYVNLYIEAVIGDDADGKGTPTVATLEAVEESIENPTVDRPSRKPLLDKVNYIAITPKDVAINITSFADLTAEKETAIFDSVKDFLSEVRPFVDSIDVLADKNNTFSIYNVISIVLSLYPGSSFGTVSMTIDGSPVDSYTFDGGNIPYLDEITYV